MQRILRKNNRDYYMSCYVPTPNFYDLPIPMTKERNAFFQKYQECSNEKLGDGMSGSVIRGIRRADHLSVAIKRVKKSQICNEGRVNGNCYPLEFFLLNIVSSCDGVIKLLDAFETVDDYIFILELLPDCWTLEDFIRHHGFMSEDLAKTFFSELCKTVMECHQLGVVHRDIKEPNILIDKKTNKPKLIDFGLSKLIDSSGYREISGTPGYMSPEMFDVSKKYDGVPTDVFALGVILYDVIFGTISWCQPIVKSHKTVPQISLECLSLIDKMLTSEPKDRPTLYQVLEHPWMKIN